MALTILTGSAQAAAINYSYRTSGSSDWTSVPTASYFYDIVDKKVRYKSTNGDIQGFDTFPYTGSANISGSLTITSGSITMPNRPAFRVTGAGGAKTAVTVLSGSYLTVDYQQGTGWDNSTGTFTAPIDGLYQVNVVTRINSNSLGTISQLIVYKNNTTISPSPNGTPQIMIEFGELSTMNHAGGSTIAKLAVGDTLKMVVAVGEISFDANDNFSVAYIG